jgi:hypothetical protein
VLKLDDIDGSDWPKPHRIFSFRGYPATVNKPNLRDRTLTPTIQPYSSFFDVTRAEEAGTKKIIQPRKPNGISGGPVWRMGSFAELYRGTKGEKVVGVAVQSRNRPSLLLGTRILVLIEAIRKRCPDLSGSAVAPSLSDQCDRCGRPTASIALYAVVDQLREHRCLIDAEARE